MAKKSSAFQRLLDRNLGDSVTKKKLKSEKKLQKKRRDEVRRQKKSVNSKKPEVVQATTELSAEITALKEEIAKEINVKPNYVKRQYRSEVPKGWEGLTPGLAPVGYDPDEDDDSDDDPY